MSVPRPTDFELTILRTLWQEGPTTVRHVHDVLRKEKELGYTTVLKTMQIMAEKGLLVRDTTNMSHVYATSETQDQTQQTPLDHLLSKAFDGSTMKLVMQALTSNPASQEDLDQIRELLDRNKGKKP
jgi:predicted transcriptional regulator